MKQLHEFTMEELTQELERRRRQKPIKPSPLVHPNFDVLRKEVTDFLEWLRSEDYHEDELRDWEIAIHEAAINSFYDKSVWPQYIIPIMKWHDGQ